MLSTKIDSLLRVALFAMIGSRLLVLPHLTFAQNAQGTIAGHVTDVSGAVVPSANVTITELSTGVVHTAVTNGAGDYYVPALNPGHYSVAVAGAGFQQEASGDVLLEVDQTLRQNFSLHPGDVSQTVQVSSDTQMLHTDDTTIGQVISAQLIEQLPINGRDFTNLMLTNAGTSITPGGSGTVWGYHGLNTAYTEVSANGTQAQSTSYSVDGIYDADYFFSVPINIPNELAVQEFKMLNGMYGAENGQGAAQVNVAIKSGTNQLHGAAYETIQNNLFQPDNKYTEAQNLINGTHIPASTPYHQNQFGGTLGGPLVIPHVYDGRNRTFWFGSYDEGLYSATQSPSPLFAPSANELKGNFSEWPFPIYNPLTTVPNPAYNSSLPPGPLNSPVIRTPFPNNQIPTSQIDPVAAKIAAYYAAPNNSNCTEAAHITTGCDNYSTSPRQTKKQGVGTVRLDQYFGTADHVFLTGNLGTLSQTQGSANFGQGGETYARPRLFGATWAHTFSSNTLNQATLGYTRNHFLNGPDTAYGPNLSAEVGLKNYAPNPATFDLPNVCPFNYYCIGGGEPTTYIDNIYQGVDTLTMVRGRHALSFGIDVRRLQLYEIDNYLGTGSLTFNGQYTSLVPTFAGMPLANANGSGFSSTAPYQGNAFADFLLGDSQSATGPPPLATDNYNLWGNNWNLFAQDSFRATDRLTLNYGLRWERPANLHNNQNNGYAFSTANGGQFRWANCSFVQPILAAGGNPNYLGCGASNTLVPIDNKDFAPRIGFAYQPGFSDKFVVRGGFGIFYGTYNRYYDGTQYNKNSLYNESAAPYASTTGTETHSTAVLANLWSPPISANQLFTLPSYLFPFNQVNWPYNHNPYDEQWSLDTQYQLTQSLLLDVGYVGDHGLRQPSQDIVGAGTPPTVANDACNSLADISQATGNNASCLTDPNFQPIDTRTPYVNMPPYFYANINGFQSSYNALQVQLIQRTTKGLTYHANYTYSKAMDLTSGINLVRGEPSLIQDPQHPYQMYGFSASDQTHRFVATYAYQVPNHLINVKHMGWLLNGWGTSGIYQLSSGFPFSIGGGASADQMAVNYASRILANSTGHNSPGFKSTLGNFFDTSKYSTPALGTYGNTNKSPERTPYFTNFDASFSKTTHITESQALLIRGEFFNLQGTWHSSTTLVFPDATVTDANFGSLINRTYGNVSLWNPHIVQLTAQYSF